MYGQEFALAVHQRHKSRLHLQLLNGTVAAADDIHAAMMGGEGGDARRGVRLDGHQGCEVSTRVAQGDRRADAEGWLPEHRQVYAFESRIT